MRQSNWRLFIAVLLLVGITNVSHGQTDADFDSDGEVGFADFLMFAGAFNSTESKYDLNGNGTVDFPDFILLSGLFGQKQGHQTLRLHYLTVSRWRLCISHRAHL